MFSSEHSRESANASVVSECLHDIVRAEFMDLPYEFEDSFYNAATSEILGKNRVLNLVAKHEGPDGSECSSILSTLQPSWQDNVISCMTARETDDANIRTVVSQDCQAGSAGKGKFVETLKMRESVRSSSIRHAELSAEQDDCCAFSATNRQQPHEVFSCDSCEVESTSIQSSIVKHPSVSAETIPSSLHDSMESGDSICSQISAFADSAASPESNEVSTPTQQDVSPTVPDETIRTIRTSNLRLIANVSLFPLEDNDKPGTATVSPSDSGSADAQQSPADYARHLLGLPTGVDTLIPPIHQDESEIEDEYVEITDDEYEEMTEVEEATVLSANETRTTSHTHIDETDDESTEDDSGDEQGSSFLGSDEEAFAEPVEQASVGAGISLQAASTRCDSSVTFEDFDELSIEEEIVEVLLDLHVDREMRARRRRNMREFKRVFKSMKDSQCS